MSIKNSKSSLLEDLRELMSNVDIKTYIYAILVIGVLSMIFISVKDTKRYGSTSKDGKFTLKIENIARDYGINLRGEEQDVVDYVNNDDNNLTQDLSQSLFLTNLYLEQNGLTDPTLRGKILGNVILNYQNQLSGNIYNEGNLNIVREDTKTDVEAYYKDMNIAINSYKARMVEINKQKENLLKYENLENPTVEIISQMKSDINNNIEKTINNNKALINDLLGIPATKGGAIYQLQLINLLSKQNTFLKSLAQIDEDPAKYLIIDGDNFETRFTNDLNSINLALNNYFNNFNIKTN